MTVIATAGHVDHGKSSLVRQLTGTDPDRLDEEKARGLTIDLGFASTVLKSGQAISFIDVPGHIKFLRNMISGVGAIDGCVFVVSAVEGWKPQSEEHLQILNLLGIRRGVIAITKADLVDEELLELAKMEAEDQVAGTFLEDAPIVGTSTTSGVGISELRAELEALVAPETDGSLQRPRLWVDRAFSPSGSGTVVTGTLTGGNLTLDDEVRVVPGDRPCRVRALQNHNETLSTVAPRNRVAVNLSGIDHHELGRGDCLITTNGWHFSDKIDAELQVLDDLDHVVDRRGAYFAYVGSAELSAKIQILGGQRLEAGAVGNIRLYLERPVAAQPGDRYLLRESGRNETIGGGQFLDVEPLLPTTKAKPDRSVERLVSERGWVEAEHLSRLVGRPIEATVGRWQVDPELRIRAESELRSTIASAGDLGFDIGGLDDKQRALVDLADDIVVTGTMVTIGQPVSDLASHPWLDVLGNAGFSPPPPEGISAEELRQLIRQKLVVERDGIVFAATTVRDAALLLREGFAVTPEGMTVSQIRDIWATSRKYALALLGEMDDTGLTRRRGDMRIPGPRLSKI